MTSFRDQMAAIWPDVPAADGPRLLLTPRPDDPNPVAKAIGIAIRQLLQLQLPRIRGEADAADFESRGETLTAVAKIFDGVFAAIGAEGAHHSHSVNAGDFTSFISDMVHGHALAAQFAEAAEKLTEERRDAAGENPGTVRARMFGRE